MRSLIGAALILATLAQAAPAHAQGTNDIFSRISPAKMASLLQDAGYRAEIVKDDDLAKTYIKTGIGGYNVAVSFFDCNKVDCEAIQFNMFFAKDPKFTLVYANKWNETHRYLKAYIDADGQLVLNFDTDLTGGVTAGYIKDQTTLFQTMIAEFDKS